MIGVGKLVELGFVFILSLIAFIFSLIFINKELAKMIGIFTIGIFIALCIEAFKVYGFVKIFQFIGGN